MQSKSFCQNSEEWLNQKKTQEKYLKQQIAALQVYIGYAKTGYKIVNKGITTIQNIKKGDFNLHRDFITSFKSVNPRIKGYAKVADIISYQLRIIKQTKEMFLGAREAGQFTANEMNYCSMVIGNLLNSSLDNIEELITIITNGELSMKDNERIKRIDALYADMQDKYSFVSSFSEEMGLLTVQRMRELHDVDISKKINGLQ
ncbi:MAG: hypothetical protein IPI78_19005 [Chitinophagaceae bacterium]|nr:hypothetical protein [Chitinophagaceae bacterium]